MLIFPPVSKAGPSHPQVLHQPQVLDLMPYEQVVKLAFGNTEGRGKDPMAPFQPRQTTGCKLIICGLDLATDIFCQVLCCFIFMENLQENVDFWLLFIKPRISGHSGEGSHMAATSWMGAALLV